MIGICIKHSLENNLQWLDLQNDLTNLTQQVKQSDVSFLRPISLSKKARWLNIKNIIQWLSNIYAYEKQSDFHLISNGIKILNSQQLFEQNKALCKNKYEQKRLEKDFKDTIFENEKAIENLLFLQNSPNLMKWLRT